MSNSNRRHLDDLPRVFQTEDGKVDIAIVRDIFSSTTVQRASGKIRDLLKDVLGIKLRPNDDPFTYFCDHIADIEFREKWYAAKSKKNTLRALFVSVDLRVQQKHPNLGYNSKTLENLFEERNNARFPKLEKIRVLSEQIKISAANSTVDAALFAWSLIESTQWFSIDNPREASLCNFRKTLLEDLKSLGLDEVLDLLECGKFSKRKSEVQTEDIKKSKSSLLADTPEPEPDCVKSFKSQYKLKMRELDTEYEHANTALRQIQNEIDYNLRTCSFSESSGKVIASINCFREKSLAANNLSSEIERLICNSVVKSLTNLALPSLTFEFSKFSLDTIDGWKKTTDTQSVIAEEVIRHTNSLYRFDSKLIHTIVENNDFQYSGLGDLAQVLNHIEDEASKLSLGQNAKEELALLLKKKQAEFNWNPILDPNVPSELWLHIGELLIQQSSANHLLGICTRKKFKELKEGVSRLIDSLSLENERSLSELREFLTTLTLGEIEGLSCATNSGRTLIALFELESFLLLSEKYPTEAYALWSSHPLSDFINENGTTLERFFWSIYDAAGQDVKNKVSIKALSQLYSSACTGITPDAKVINDGLFKDLLAILEFHPGGGQTYSLLWNQAYKTICQPIKEATKTKNINDIAKLYRSFRENFVVGDYLNQWKSTLPEHLRKRSEYEKKLRLSVQGKLEALDGWLDSYDTAIITKNHISIDASFNSVLHSIAAIIQSQNPECNIVKKWLHSLDTVSSRSSASLITLSTSVGGGINGIYFQGDVDPFHPRVFLANCIGDTATIEDYFADEMYQFFGLYSTNNLAQLYSDQQLFEAFSSLSLESPEGVSISLDRQVEAEIQNLTDQYLSRVVAIEEKIGELNSDAAELILSSVRDIRALLTDHRWTKVNFDLSDTERDLAEFIKDENDHRLSLRLIEDILALGGSTESVKDIESLKKIYEKLIIESAPRRKHLEYINQITSIDHLDSLVLSEFKLTFEELSRPSRLPSQQRSDELAYIFSETIEFLADQLKRSKNLIQLYRNRLNQLALTLSKTIRAEGVLEGSPIINNLYEFSSDWKEIPEGDVEVIDRLLKNFPEIEFPPFAQGALSSITVQVSPIVTGGQQDVDSQGNTQSYHILSIKWLSDALARIADSNSINEVERSLSVAAKNTIKKLDSLKDSNSQKYLGCLTDWTVSVLSGGVELFTTEEMAAALHFINRYPKQSAIISLLPSKSSKGRLGTIVISFLKRIAIEVGLGATNNPTALIETIADNIEKLTAYRRLIDIALSPYFTEDSLSIKAIWDFYSGDPRQAETRAQLMNILWQTSCPRALACCLKYSPIDIEGRTADALALNAEQAINEGRGDLLQSFIDLQRTITAKPYQIFVGLLQSNMPTKADPPAQISFATPPERGSNPRSLNGIFSIKPRRSDSPASLTLKLPQNAPITFDTGLSNLTLQGPFLKEEHLVHVSFLLQNQNASSFVVPVDCLATSITGKISPFSIRLGFELGGTNAFSQISPDEIEEAFQHFPHAQMRGNDYIHRPEDERRIERDLFESKNIRSLWISSPRRSGKTTMLYRILDSYSHKAGRENYIAYLSLNKGFENTTAFNDWVWKTLKNSPDNKELRGMFERFADVGLDLPYDADVGAFVECIADRILSSLSKSGSDHRVIFLFDEIDRLATMYFEGSARKDAALEIAWQLRQLIGRRKDVGFVFAGSSAAKRIFLTNPEAPFFNSGILFELSRFSAKSASAEKYSREIAEPERIRGRLTVPKTSLEHIIWICSGIPYYMKLLAGATYAVARQSHILEGDVVEGLHALLDKRTGISRLDEVEGDPGSDELRTIALEKGDDRLLTQAALYAVADLESPVTAHALNRGRLFGENSYLIKKFQLPRQAIERGLDLCIELGLLKLSSDSTPKILFSTPILGESIRHSSGAYWAEIDNQLEKLSIELRPKP